MSMPLLSVILQPSPPWQTGLLPDPKASLETSLHILMFGLESQTTTVMPPHTSMDADSEEAKPVCCMVTKQDIATDHFDMTALQLELDAHVEEVVLMVHMLLGL
jgi:hypothetical protein